MRNGKAGADGGRELRDKGKRQAQRVGLWLAGQGMVPDVALAVPSARAQVTGEKTLKAGGLGVQRLSTDDRLGSVAGACAALAEIGTGTPRVLMVAHRGVVADLAEHLAGADACRKVGAVKPGTLVRLKMPDDWLRLSAGCAQLADVVLPANLPERFPFPTPGGTEWRDRPPYYYRQSAVIPWRRKTGGVEVLVITSSKRNHWVVPKGIHEPGLSAQDSAAEEAREEAGVLGRVGADPLGSYLFEKWGAPCRVTVYPMQVTEVLDGDDWEESHRSRLWVSPREAARQLKQPELAEIVGRFTLPEG